MRPKKRNIVKMLFFAAVFSILTAMTAAGGEAWAAGKAPGLNASATKKNVLNLLEKYDKDGAYVMKKQIAAGDNVLSWFQGGGRIIDNIDTAVHEETHGYSFSYASSRKGYAYFVGNKRTVYVKPTKVFRSKKTASSVPKRLRTSRYRIYVAKPVQNLASDVLGPYGLLNEFMAYRMGMNNTVSLYPYYVAKKAGWDEWKVFVNSCENDRLAYAEFKYFILHYLSYAKSHDKAVYNGIVNNKQFCRAYRIMEASYAKLIARYEKYLKKLPGVFKKKGYKMTVTKDSVMVYNSRRGGTGLGRFSEDYQNLLKEMKKTKYKSIHNKLIKNGK